MSEKPTDKIQLMTSAPEAYDGFSVRTIRAVGMCNYTGRQVRLVEVERRDYEWLTTRYASGCQRYTDERCTAEDYARLGDWVMWGAEWDAKREAWAKERER